MLFVIRQQFVLTARRQFAYLARTLPFNESRAHDFHIIIYYASNKIKFASDHRVVSLCLPFAVIWIVGYVCILSTNEKSNFHETTFSQADMLTSHNRTHPFEIWFDRSQIYNKQIVLSIFLCKTVLHIHACM